MSDKTIAIRIDEDFHKAIKVRIAESGQTLTGYLQYLIREDLRNWEESKMEGKGVTIVDAIHLSKQLVKVLNEVAENN